MSCALPQVRTPLNGCLASAEMLLETPLGAEQRELARTIRVSGSILLSTVSNFLDFFKLEAGKQLDVVRTEINIEVRGWRCAALLCESASSLQQAVLWFFWQACALRVPCAQEHVSTCAGREVPAHVLA